MQVSKKFINAVTHIIFAGGKAATLEHAAKRSIHVLAPSWVAAFVAILLWIGISFTHSFTILFIHNYF